MLLLRIVLKICVLVASASARCRRSVDDSPANCQEPSELEPVQADLYAQLIQAQTNSIYPGWSDDSGFHNIPAQYKNITIIHFQGDSNVDCNTVNNEQPGHTNHHNSHHHRHHHNHHSIGRQRINAIASCPFRYVKNFDPNRMPSTLLESQCLCQRPTDRRGFCQEVFMYVSVLRRSSCDQGQWSYTRVWEKISVACVTLQSPPPSGHAGSYIMPRMSAT